MFGLVVLAAFVALGSWLVRTRRVSPFGVLGRTLRTLTDPVLRPVERRLHRMGGNPANAGGWLIVLTAIAGIVLLSLLGWLAQTFYVAEAAANAGPKVTLTLIIFMVYRILVFALIVRVVAAWFGLFRYSKWIRPAYVLTDWIVEPLRRVVPPFGAMDITPLVAWLVLWFLRWVLLQGLSVV
ncbi:MAG TPA: YggT family protein [Gemmatimonadales bacterium]|nr:YggT family protein [Gemmatimonadales bacterium]